MKQTQHARRQFLLGAGGFSLGLPFLPSLLPRTARAQTFRPRYFAGMFSHHGGIHLPNMHPSAASFTNRSEIFPKHFASWGNLQRQVSGDDAFVSPVLRTKANVLTERLVGKMNTFAGLDIPFNIGHHTGGILGNYNRTNTETVVSVVPPRPTFDQLLAWSPSFYPSLDGVRARSLVMGGNFQGISWEWSNPATKSGTIQRVPVVSAAQAFRTIFTPGEAGMSMQRRPSIVDRVITNYQSLRDSNRRLSVQDRQRLNDHMQRLSELQRTITNLPNVDCSSTTRSTNMTDLIGPDWTSLAEMKQVYRGVNEVIAAAFLCGGSRLASINVTGLFTPYAGSWHQDVAHQGNSPVNQALLVEENRQIFEQIFADLASRLDVEDGSGQTVLDNALIMWMHESGPSTHDNQSTPVITAGSAGGFFKTGRAFDYRNQVPSAFTSREVLIHTGITHNRFMATALRAMGSPSSEWERPGQKGYGDPLVEPHFSMAYGTNQTAILSSASEILPFLNS